MERSIQFSEQRLFQASVDSKNTIEWDGNELSGWIMINGVATKVSADRDTIHAHARGFNDALTWEINRHRIEIFEKLAPFFQSRATNSVGVGPPA
jgi:hypothetical protein